MNASDKRIDSPARVCSVTGKLFAQGDVVCSMLLDDVNEFLRVDMLESAAASYTPPRFVVCRWRWTVKPRDNRAREEAKSALEQIEAMFTALCSETDASNAPEAAERAVLRHLLALALQRKRILKPIINQPGKYRRAGTNEVFNAPPPTEMTPEIFKKAAEKLAGGMQV